MFGRCKNKGFSLTEVLMSAGILAVGFMLIASVFPVGIELTAISIERNIGATAADEAVAKLMIYGVEPASLPPGQCTVFSAATLPNATYLRLYVNSSLPKPIGFDPATDPIPVGLIPAVLTLTADRLESETLYPSIPDYKYQADPTLRPKYCWSALCRQIGPQSVQATVFVSRRSGAATMYPDPADPLGSTVDRPAPIAIDVLDPPDMGFVNEIEILDPDLAKYVTDDSMLVDSQTGQRMQVLSREIIGGDTIPRRIILTDAVFDTTIPIIPRQVWVIPTAVSGGRYPCVAVYQRELDF